MRLAWFSFALSPLFSFSFLFLFSLFSFRSNSPFSLISISLSHSLTLAVVGRSRWHVAYHSTTIDALNGILPSGALAPPGREVVTGADARASVAVRDGHIPAPFERFNPHTRRRETFDPNQVRGARGVVPIHFT
jgi:hypothetical protein